MRIAYNTWSMKTVPYDVFIPHVARSGFDAIIIAVKQGWAADLEQLTRDDRQHIKRLLREHHLPLAALMGHQPVIGDDPKAVRYHLRRLRDTIDLCAELADGDVVPTMNTGGDGRQADWETKRQQLVDRLGELAAYGASRGVVVAFEPHIDQAVDRPERAVWLVRQVGNPYLRQDFDVSHFELVDIPTKESVAALAPYAASVEIKDQKFRYTDQPEPSGWRVPGNGSGRSIAPNGREVEYQFLLPGEGTFELPNFLRLMQQAGWTGSIGFEVSVQVQARPNFDPLATAELVYRWMENGWRAVGVAR